MSDSALVRTARALDLIPYVVQHPGIGIEDLAQVFNTSAFEITETLNIVFMCGLPGYTPLELIDLSTEDDVVSIIDPQNLSKPRSLRQVEVVSILLGLSTLKIQGVKPEVTPLIENVEKKFRALLPSGHSLDLVSLPGELPGYEWRERISEAIRKRETIDIDYTSIGKEERSTRRVKPIRIYSLGGYIYCEAISGTDSPRHFRLDRIHGVALATSVEESADKSANMASSEIVIDVLVPNTALLFLERVEQLIESKDEYGEYTRIVLRVNDVHWILRGLSSINGKVEVIAPDTFREIFARYALAALENYSD